MRRSGRRRPGKPEGELNPTPNSSGCSTRLEFDIVPGRKWWAHSDLNRGPSDYESPALTAELWALKVLILPRVSQSLQSESGQSFSDFPIKPKQIQMKLDAGAILAGGGQPLCAAAGIAQRSCPNQPASPASRSTRFRSPCPIQKSASLSSRSKTGVTNGSRPIDFAWSRMPRTPMAVNPILTATSCPRRSSTNIASAWISGSRWQAPAQPSRPGRGLPQFAGGEASLTLSGGRPTPEARARGTARLLLRGVKTHPRLPVGLRPHEKGV